MNDFMIILLFTLRSIHSKRYYLHGDVVVVVGPVGIGVVVVGFAGVVPVGAGPGTKTLQKVQ